MGVLNVQCSVQHFLAHGGVPDSAHSVGHIYRQAWSNEGHQNPVRLPGGDILGNWSYLLLYPGADWVTRCHHSDCG